MADLRKIEPNIINDLVVSRSLMFACLEADQLVAAMAYAITTSKILPTAFKIGLTKSDILLAPAVRRAMQQLAEVVGDYLSQFDGWEPMADEVAAAITEIIR